jgi:hypothetical protein
MVNISRSISRACGKTSDEADVMHQAAGQHLSSTLEAGAMHQAARWNEMSKPDM